MKTYDSVFVMGIKDNCYLPVIGGPLPRDSNDLRGRYCVPAAFPLGLRACSDLERQ